MKKTKEGTKIICTIERRNFNKKHIQLIQFHITGCASIKKTTFYSEKL